MTFKLKPTFTVKTAPACLLTGYFLLNLLFLTRFPVMHSDESWLSGLSRAMAATHKFSITEPFFDLKPRIPHGIRILYHFVQVMFIKVFGYHLFGFRLISLSFAVICLYFFYRLALHLFKRSDAAGLAALLLSFDIQYIYTAHFARPEIIILTGLILGSYYLLRHDEDHHFSHDLILSAIVGLSIGVHPNGFIVAGCFILFYLYQIFVLKKWTPFNLALLITGICLAAFVFIRMSYNFNANFLPNYLNYGQSQFGVLNPLSAKCQSFLKFYRNIYLQNSGTYYSPNYRAPMILFLLVIIGSVIMMIKSKNDQQINLPLLAIFGVNLGILAIGRFNQTSIVFQIPFVYLLIVKMIIHLPASYKRNFAILLSILLITISTAEIVPYLPDSYPEYLQTIAAYVPRDQRTLASLNTEYYFKLGRLYDFRNLAYLKQNRMTFRDYIRKNRIRYIIYPESLDWIYRRRPEWNNVYGSLAGYYREMKQFLRKDCIEIGEFTDSAYGIEIGRYLKRRNWRVTIFEVQDTSGGN